MTQRFCVQVEEVLQESGWFPGRSLTDQEIQHWCAFRWKFVPGYCRILPAAVPVLREFGGLVVEQDAPGQTCYRESFCINPLRTIGINESGWIGYELMLEQPLFPLGVYGELLDDLLAIDAMGRIFCIAQGIPSLTGKTIEEALSNLILGRASFRVDTSSASHNLAHSIQAKLKEIWINKCD